MCSRLWEFLASLSGRWVEAEIAALRPDGSLRNASTYVDPMLTPDAAAGTLRLVPR
jgi:hypothetical protein